MEGREVSDMNARTDAADWYGDDTDLDQFGHPCDCTCDDCTFDWIDCAMMPNGQCGKAGSEECDWDCPVMREIHQKRFAKREQDKPGPLL
jgi:hypothetical protein